MVGWFTDLTPTERKTFWACFSGWALDAMDVQLYALAMPTLIVVWSLTKSQAGLLATTALIVSAFGGWVAGMLADRFGRATILKITVVWFSVFTALAGFTNSFDQLMIIRSLQGLGFGGEWAAGAVLMCEVIRKEYRGRAVGAVQSGWSVGYGLAALLFTVMFSLFPPDQAWRALFWVGILPGLFVIVYRRGLDEPQIYRQAKVARVRDKTVVRLGDVFRPPLLRSTVLASCLAGAALGGNYTILNWLPTYLSTVLKLSVLGTGGYLAVNIAGSFCGYLTAAHLSDYLGRRRTFISCALCAAAVVVCYMLIPLSRFWVLVLGFPLGFFQSGIISGMGATFAELFPTNLRATGQGFSYNFGRGVGALVPALVGFLSNSVPLNVAIGGCAFVAYLGVVFAALMLPETKGKELAMHELGVNESIVSDLAVNV